MTGDIGTGTDLLNAVNINGSGKTVTLTGDLHANTTTIANLATLKFNKSATAVSGNIVNSGTGTLDIGTTTVTTQGTVTLGANAKLVITVGTTSGQLIATNAGATLAAGTTIVPSINGTVATGDTFIILKDDDGNLGLAGGVGSSTGLVITNPTGTTFSISVVGNNLVLTADAVLGEVLDSFSSSAKAVSAVTDTAFASDSVLSTALDGLAGDELEKALEALAPVVDGGTVSGVVDSGDAFINTVSERISSLRAGIPSAGQGLNAGDDLNGARSFWLQGFGSYADQDKRQGVNGFTATTGGLAFGFDKQINNTLLLGVTASYARTDIDASFSHNRTTADSFQSALYGSIERGAYFIDAQFGLVYNDYKGDRFINVGTVSRHANSDYSGYQILSHFELGRDMNLPNDLRFTPSIGFSWVHVGIGSYVEQGAGASNLRVDGQDYDIINLSLNGELARTWDVAGGKLTPEAHLGYNYEALDQQIQSVSTFSGGGNAFTSTGFDPANHSVQAGLGFTFATDNNLD